MYYANENYKQTYFLQFHIDGVRHITPVDAMVALLNNDAVLIGVREEEEYKLNNIPLDNVLYHPSSLIMDRLSFIPKEQNIIVGCPMGTRSTKVANLLNRQGYPNVANLDGGFSMWRAKDLPWKSNLTLNCGEGCSCNCNSEAANTTGKSCC